MRREKESALEKDFYGVGNNDASSHQSCGDGDDATDKEEDEDDDSRGVFFRFTWGWLVLR